MHFLTQTIIAAAFLAGAVFSVPSPQAPINGGSGGDQGTCYWKCCEFDNITGGSLCKGNASPYPHAVDCSVDMEFPANMTCCHQTDCSDQTVMPKPITVV
ncbi:hypothetical protein NHQ30_001263 [Ciborinia camelliae]|nr:hypothetical protein NHQ30_001263 [Ciborinia camelliae]